MVKGEQTVGYDTITAEMPAKKSVRSYKFVFTALTVLSATVAVACLLFNASVFNSEVTQELASGGVQYGMFVALKNVYNEYVLVGYSGRAYSGGYHGELDHIQILSATGASGSVSYGDQVLLVGHNSKYFVVRDSGVITCRQPTVIPNSKWTIMSPGNTGTVQWNDYVAFKGVFGYMTASRAGIRGDTSWLTSLEKYQIQRPGEEDGYHLDEPLMYGMSVMFKNLANEYLQTASNGWVYVRSDNGVWNHFDVLSPLHRQGDVRYGDSCMLRAHNGNMVLSRQDGLTAYVAGPKAHTVFQLIGGSGQIHEGDPVAFRCPDGYINAQMAGRRAGLDRSGHYSVTSNFYVIFVDKT